MTFRGERSVNVGGWTDPILFVSKCHQIGGQMEIATASQPGIVFVNERRLFPSVNQLWCVPTYCFLGFLLISLISLCGPLAFYRYQQQCLCECVLGWIVCVCMQGTWPLSHLFSLKSCSVAEQKAISRSPLLWVGIVVYLYLRVQVAFVQAALFYPTVFQFAVTSCSFT